MTVHLYPTMSKNAEYAAYVGRISDLSSLGSHEAALFGFWPISNGYYQEHMKRRSVHLEIIKK